MTRSGLAVIVRVITLSMQQPNFPVAALIFLISNCSVCSAPPARLSNWFNGKLPHTAPAQPTVTSQWVGPPPRPLCLQSSSHLHQNDERQC